MKPRIITACTPDYRQYATRLARSCQRFGLELDLYPLSDAGSWVANCAQKPEVIFKAMIASDRPVVWLDADAEVMQEPTLLYETSLEFAIHRRTNHLGFGSGTVYFGKAALGLVALWCQLQRRNPEWWDQKALRVAWEELDAHAMAPSTMWLPPEYLQKIDEPEGAVILHHQASRFHNR